MRKYARRSDSRPDPLWGFGAQAVGNFARWSLSRDWCVDCCAVLRPTLGPSPRRLSRGPNSHASAGPSTGPSAAPTKLMALKCRATVVVACLMIGGGIYLGQRQPTLVMFHWADAAHLTPFLDSWRALFQVVPLPGWVVFSLPQGLWGAAFVLSVDQVWSKTDSEPIV